jgi:hypothetical protein
MDDPEKGVNMTRIPSIQQAENFLAEAERLNPGPWVEHSRHAASIARMIAKQHPDLDADTAYTLGLLHDIGRRAGKFEMRHIIDGYDFLHDLGYEDAARICLTHSFPIKDVRLASAKWDCSEEEYQFVVDFLATAEYSTYDALIQLCDCMALPQGPCLLEKRFVDVALRYGTNEHTIPKWQAYFDLKARFEQAIRKSIYDHLPGVVENTFGF